MKLKIKTAFIILCLAIACSESKKEVKQNIPEERTIKIIEESVLNRIDSSFIPSDAFTVPFDSAKLIDLTLFKFHSIERSYGQIWFYNIINIELKYRMNSKKKHCFVCLEFPYQKMQTGSSKEYHNTLLIFDTTTYKAAYLMWLNQPANYQDMKNLYVHPYYEWGIDDWTDTIISSISFLDIKKIFPRFKGVVCNKYLDSIELPNIYDFQYDPGGNERFLDSIHLKFRFPKRPLVKGREPDFYLPL